MKKKLAVIIIFIFGIFIVVGNLCKPTDFSIEGKVMEKYEKAFLLETDTSDKILCNCPKNYDISQLEINDKITVYFNGKILETYPAQIKKTTKIKK